MEQASQMPPAAAQPSRGSVMTASGLAVIGGALVVIGSIVPWAKVSVLSVFSVNIKGTESDGWITFTLGVLLALVGLLGLVQGNFIRVAAVVLGLGTLGMAIYEMTRVNSALDDVRPLLEPLGAQAQAVASVSTGIGLWLILAGAVIGIATFFLKPSRS